MTAHDKEDNFYKNSGKLFTSRLLEKIHQTLGKGKS